MGFSLYGFIFLHYVESELVFQGGSILRSLVFNISITGDQYYSDCMADGQRAIFLYSVYGYCFVDRFYRSFYLGIKTGDTFPDDKEGHVGSVCGGIGLIIVDDDYAGQGLE